MVWLMGSLADRGMNHVYQPDVMDPLCRISRQGGGGVLHDRALAARHCDRVAVLEDGRLAGEGPPDAGLERVFGIAVARGIRPGGTADFLPWSRPGPPLRSRTP